MSAMIAPECVTLAGFLSMPSMQGSFLMKTNLVDTFRSQPIMRGSRGSSSGLALRQDHRGMRLTGLLGGPCSAGLFPQLTPVYLGMVPPTVDRVFPQQSLFPTISYRHDGSSAEVPSCQVPPARVKLTGI